MFKYAQIENAMAGMHGIMPETRKTFQARIRHYQKIGMIPSAPGKGKKIEYTHEILIGWAMCLQMAEAGLSPSLTMKIMDVIGYYIVGYFMGKQKEKNLVIVIQGEILKNQMRGKPDAFNCTFLDESDDFNKIYDVMKPMFSTSIWLNVSDTKEALGAFMGIDWSAVDWSEPTDGWIYRPQAGEIATH